MKFNAKKITLLCLLLITAHSCTRQAEKTPLKDSGMLITGPTEKDSKLELMPLPTEKMKNQLAWKGTVATADYFRTIEALKDISVNERNESLEKLSRSMYESFYKVEATHGITTFADSIYLDMALGEAELDIRSELDTLDKQITSGVKSINSLLNASKKNFPWPKNLENFDQGLDIIDSYIAFLLKGLTQINLSPALQKAAVAAISSEYQKARPEIEKTVKAIDNADSLQKAIDALKSAIIQLKLPLGKAELALLNKGGALAKDLAQMESSQDALTIIIYVWRMVPESDRKTVFKAKVPEIYDFLNGKSEASLDCLAAPLCANPILEVARRIVILPKISEYGVHRIQNEIDSAALGYLRESVLEEAVNFLPTLPEAAKKEMQTQVKEITTLMASIQKDMPAFVKKRAAKWQKNNFSSNINGLEISGFALNFTGRDKIAISTPKELNGTSSSGAEVIGTSLSLAQAFLPEKENKLKAALVAPILKLTAMGGFRQIGGANYPSLNLPLKGKRDNYFNLINLLKDNIPYAVPDSFTAKNNFLMDRKSVKANASVGAQAELLRGISKQIKFYRDWEKNTFDELLGSYQVEDVVTDVPRGSVNFSLFPKEYIFTLAVGNAGAILQNIIHDLSPAFLLLPEGELLWGDHYKEISDNKFSTIAGLVNIEEGARAKTVKTEDIARYILALDEFLEATEGIENTKSPILQEKNADGITVIEQLTDARRYLKLFMLGLTNYLVRVAKDDGGISSFAQLENNLTIVEGPRLLTTQALSIRALLTTANRLNMPIYHWTALNSYYFMNKKLWNKETQFYQSENAKAATLPEILTTLQAIQDLEPIMEAGSRIQAKRLIKPWIKALEDL